ncbi:Mechanosensitive ion channel-domain-containing protein [Butyriboletus roseoflavus]|nr:Mechanosensitive ion channel-domain-containing protein [Butyriboletus roseoflavus]
MHPTKGYRQDSQNSDISQKQSARPTVHYAEELDHAPSAQYVNTPPKLESRAPSFAGTDEDDGDREEFDWSDDEDLADEEAKFEKQMGVNLRARRWTIWRLFTILFSSLIGSVFLAGILVAPALLVHFFWYKPHPTSYRHYVDQNIEAWLFWAAANVVISWGLAMIVDIVPATTRILISIAWGHVSEKVKSHIELYDSVKDTFKPVLYAASAWLSWHILFQNIFGLYNSGASGTNSAPYTDRVAQIIEFLFFLVLGICSQRILSHAIALAFHRTAYKERLEEVKCGLRVIEKLRDYKPRTRQHNNWSSSGHGMFNLGFIHPFGERDSNRRQRDVSVSQGYDGGNDADAEDNKGKGKQRPTDSGAFIRPHDITPDLSELEDSKTPTSRPAFYPSHEKQNITHEYPPSRKRAAGQHMHQQEGHNPAIQAARVIKSAILHDARNITGNDNDLGELGFTVNSAHEAKRLARAIYKTFHDRRRTYLISADLQPAFSTPGEAQEAFRVFDKDNNGDISRSELKAAILHIYKERRFLSRSMHDVGVALRTLDQILLLFAFIILFFISLSVFGVNVDQSLTSMYSLGIAASFIFRNSASNMFDAIVFLFVTHPFDTGDRCFIDTDNLIVKKMGLFATLFVRSDGTETYYSNSQLFTKFVANVRRSDKMVEALTMQVAWRTPLEKLDNLEARLNEWLATEENRWFQPTTSITLQSISFQRHLEITISIPHNSTWQDWGMRNARKTAFHAAVQYYCRQLGITAYNSPMPLVYSDTPQYTPESERRSQEPLHGVEGSTKNFLGFTPPDQRGPQLLRARKSKSRKAILRGIVSVAATSKAMSVADLHDLELIWPSLHPTNVIVTGTFDQWSSSIHLAKGDAGFSGTVKVPWGQKVAYKFIVDGLWKCRDDRPQEDDGHGNVNNVLRTPEEPHAVFSAVHDPPARLSIPLEGVQSGDVEIMVTAVEFPPTVEISVEGLGLTPSAGTPVSVSKLDTATATEGTVPPASKIPAELAPFEQAPSSPGISILPINDNGSVSLPPRQAHDSHSFATHAPIALTKGDPPTSPFEPAVPQSDHSSQSTRDVPPVPTPIAVLESTIEVDRQGHRRQAAVPASIKASSPSTPASSTLTQKKRRSLFARFKHMFDKDSDKRERKEKNKH